MSHPIPNDVVSGAQLGQKQYGVPASVCIAQWIQESGWGHHMPAGSNNPFGIKAAGSQPYVVVPTKEFYNGRYVTVNAKFRKFASLAEACEEHGRLLATNKVYANVMAKKADAKAFANALTGKYATDPKYGSNLITLMNQNNLYQYSKVV